MTKPYLTRAAWDDWEASMRADGTRPLVIQNLKNGFDIGEPEAAAAPAPRRQAPRQAPRRAAGPDMAVRELAASLIAQGQSVADAELNASRAIAYQRGELDPEDMTAAEAQQSLKDAIAADPDLVTRQASNDPFADVDGQAMLDAQEERHLANRVQRTLAPFEDVRQDAINRHGADSPLVPTIRDLLTNAVANSRDDAERRPFKEALSYRPTPKPSIFADVEGAE